MRSYRNDINSKIKFSAWFPRSLMSCTRCRADFQLPCMHHMPSCPQFVESTSIYIQKKPSAILFLHLILSPIKLTLVNFGGRSISAEGAKRDWLGGSVLASTSTWFEVLSMAIPKMPNLNYPSWHLYTGVRRPRWKHKASIRLAALRFSHNNLHCYNVDIPFRILALITMILCRSKLEITNVFELFPHRWV